MAQRCVTSRRPSFAEDVLKPSTQREAVGLHGNRLRPQIADCLVLSETTVKTHVARVLVKLQLRIQAVIYAYGNELAPPHR